MLNKKNIFKIFLGTCILFKSLTGAEIGEVESITGNAQVKVNGSMINSFIFTFDKKPIIDEKEIKVEYNGPKGKKTYFDPKLGKNITIELTGEEVYQADIIEINIKGNSLEILTTDVPTMNNYIITIGDRKFEKNENIRVISPESDKFTYHTYKDDKVEFNYRLYTPQNKGKEKLPIILALHGSGECADRKNYDNNSHLIANRMILSWSDEKFQKNNPAYIIAPQFPSLEASYDTLNYQKAFINIIEEIVKNGNGDKNRVYASTLSMGSRIFYNLIGNFPEYFSAAHINCGNPADAKIENVKNMPLHIIHAENDTTVQTQFSIDTFTKLYSLGNKNIRLTLYPEKEMKDRNVADMHCPWEISNEEKENLEWIFSFDKSQIIEKPKKLSGNIFDTFIFDKIIYVPLFEVTKKIGYTHTIDEINNVIIFKNKENKFVKVNLIKDDVPILIKDGIIYVQFDIFSKKFDCRVELINMKESLKLKLTKK